VDFARGGAVRRRPAIEEDLARLGWRAAWRLIGGEESPAPGRRRARPTREALDERFESALAAAGVPAALGVFLDEPADATVPRLGPAAALAVLSRRSGPLYLPGRRFEPSLARLSPAVLFFPSAGCPPAGVPPEVKP
jgi:hypothetical protein